jgi:hypothetical protein
LTGKAMTRIGRTKAIASVLAMIADAFAKLIVDIATGLVEDRIDLKPAKPVPP